MQESSRSLARGARFDALDGGWAGAAGVSRLARAKTATLIALVVCPEVVSILD
jgi:hypothetical protein